MRTIANYRPAKGQKIKSLLITLLFLAAAFLAGAAVQKQANFIQDLIAAAPVALEGIKAFLNEKVVFKVNTVTSQFKWTVAITLLVIKDFIWHSVRGP
ncbi:hypothetical protein Psfp_00345 [Pelotomaculum sp. FP]|uniref:hypothetical protein n=1 Tax=Pelotomaculum sp. FP TaxID=261474 RepID=UPI001064AF98|nr:hypothetical protein [Pelotomaculum sp. FP]TEB17850.1 hypothetical protein Psfp_00345 [Pelotomaculum sp. FP]